MEEGEWYIQAVIWIDVPHSAKKSHKKFLTTCLLCTCFKCSLIQLSGRNDEVEVDWKEGHSKGELVCAACIPTQIGRAAVKCNAMRFICISILIALYLHWPDGKSSSSSQMQCVYLQFNFIIAFIFTSQMQCNAWHLHIYSYCNCNKTWNRNLNSFHYLQAKCDLPQGRQIP